jgi:hypothetical protein
VFDHIKPDDRKLIYNRMFPRVREIMFREWDPIGVSDFADAPENEYDSYATKVCGGLFNPAFTEEQCVAYLGEISSKRMLIAPCEERDRRVARALFALRDEFLR